MQVNAVARAVHAPVMDPAGRRMDPAEDAALRGAFSGRLVELLGAARCAAVRDVVDAGCATGAGARERTALHCCSSTVKRCSGTRRAPACL